MSTPGVTSQPVGPRLVVWNVDLTLVDVAQVTRAAYANAFRAVTGRALSRLPQLVGRTDYEITFEAFALNPAITREPAPPVSDDMVLRFHDVLAGEFREHRGDLRTSGKALPGAAEAIAAVAALPGVVQTVLTGSIKAVALEKLTAFGLDSQIDVPLGGYGDGPFPKGATLLDIRDRAAARSGVTTAALPTVYIGDSTRDVEAARTGGARMIGVATGQAREQELRDAGADAVLPGLTDTPAVIDAVRRLTTPPGA